jgi:hypothetical protein
MASDDLTPERARELVRNKETGLLAPLWSRILAAWERDRDRLATVTAQRDALARIAAFEVEEDSPLPYDHHYVEASAALTAIRAEQTTTTEPTDAK